MFAFILPCFSPSPSAAVGAAGSNLQRNSTVLNSSGYASAENGFMELNTNKLLSIFGCFWLESEKAISVDTIHHMVVHLNASRGWHIHFWRKPCSRSYSVFVCRSNFPGNHTGTSCFKYNWLWLCSCIDADGKQHNYIAIDALLGTSVKDPSHVLFKAETLKFILYQERECEGLRS